MAELCWGSSRCQELGGKTEMPHRTERLGRAKKTEAFRRFPSFEALFHHGTSIRCRHEGPALIFKAPLYGIRAGERSLRSVERDAVLRKRRSLAYVRLALREIPESDHFTMGVLHAWDLATYLQRERSLRGHPAVTKASQLHPSCEEEPAFCRGPPFLRLWGVLLSRFGRVSSRWLALYSSRLSRGRHEGSDVTCPEPQMLRVRSVSGEVLVAIELASFLDTLGTGSDPVRALKQHLRRFCGQSRFRQRLVFLADGVSSEEDEGILRPGEAQLMLLKFSSASEEQVQELRRAAASGMTSVVETILQKPQDPDLGHPGHPGPLLLASAHGHLEVARLLLEAKADKDKAMDDGTTPLLGAAQNEQLEVARLLLDSRADMNKASDDGATPLFIAAASGQTEVPRLLLEAKADKDKACIDGATALYIAAQNGELEVARLLLEAKADKDKALAFAATPLLVASQLGHLELARLLLLTNAYMDKAMRDGTTPLVVAAQNGQLEIVRLLLGAKADRDKGTTYIGATPLYVSAQQGQLEVAHLLLEAKADKAKALVVDGASPLHVAARQGRWEVASLLLEANADKDKAMHDGTTPLGIAAQNGQLEVVRLLLHTRADKDKTANNGATPLFVAAQKGQLKVARILLEAETDKEKERNLSATYLGVAGCTVESQNPIINGYTTVGMAALEGHNLLCGARSAQHSARHQKLHIFPQETSTLALNDCDLQMPGSPEEAWVFPQLLVDCIARKGVCVVQTFLTQEECYNLKGWAIPKKEFEAAYLGRNNSSKYTFLDADARLAQRELATSKEAPGCLGLSGGDYDFDSLHASSDPDLVAFLEGTPDGQGDAELAGVKEDVKSILSEELERAGNNFFPRREADFQVPPMRRACDELARLAAYKLNLKLDLPLKQWLREGRSGDELVQAIEEAPISGAAPKHALKFFAATNVCGAPVALEQEGQTDNVFREVAFEVMHPELRRKSSLFVPGTSELKSFFFVPGTGELSPPSLSPAQTNWQEIPDVPGEIPESLRGCEDLLSQEAPGREYGRAGLGQADMAALPTVAENSQWWEACTVRSNRGTRNAYREDAEKYDQAKSLGLARRHSEEFGSNAATSLAELSDSQVVVFCLPTSKEDEAIVEQVGCFAALPGIDHSVGADIALAYEFGQGGRRKQQQWTDWSGQYKEERDRRWQYWQGSWPRSPREPTRYDQMPVQTEHASSSTDGTDVRMDAWDASSSGTALMQAIQKTLTSGRKAEGKVRRLREEIARRDAQWQAYVNSLKVKYSNQKKLHSTDIQKLRQDLQQATDHSQAAAQQVIQLVNGGLQPEPQESAVDDEGWEDLVASAEPPANPGDFMQAALLAARAMQQAGRAGAGTDSARNPMQDARVVHGPPGGEPGATYAAPPPGLTEAGLPEHPYQLSPSTGTIMPATSPNAKGRAAPKDAQRRGVKYRAPPSSGLAPGPSLGQKLVDKREAILQQLAREGGAPNLPPGLSFDVTGELRAAMEGYIAPTPAAPSALMPFRGGAPATTATPPGAEPRPPEDGIGPVPAVSLESDDDFEENME
ncbi:Ankyrin-2 [Symbiodinium microadriaticum]|uniref:Ankyrin-2 n=1 Tax=Symbiodinium microadriaticum TaxID=2951 RepID=A0A1Q9C8V9_SYMMI|nr:Ankyrin-2 [Symbiodinium microadriaticum]